MITSDRQLAVTKKKVEILQESLGELSGDKAKSPFAKASGAQIQAFIKDLQSEVQEYEEIQAKGLDVIELKDLTDIMLIPIKYRIAKKMTQESFARKVDVPLRMIARYESEGYRNITGENFKKILSKLHLSVPGKLTEM
jgi:DNA-binding transcriptional regulator YiaG